MVGSWLNTESEIYIYIYPNPTIGAEQIKTTIVSKSFLGIRIVFYFLSEKRVIDNCNIERH